MRVIFLKINVSSVFLRMKKTIWIDMKFSWSFSWPMNCKYKISWILWKMFLRKKAINQLHNNILFVVVANSLPSSIYLTLTRNLRHFSISIYHFINGYFIIIIFVYCMHVNTLYSYSHMCHSFVICLSFIYYVLCWDLLWWHALYVDYVI